MLYSYLKALHIIFIVTWFAGLFYMPRLFIYNVEALYKPDGIRQALQEQFTLMMKRLWYGITWPSAILSLIFGSSLLFSPDYKWYLNLLDSEPQWLFVKLIFVFFLYLYHFSLQIILQQQANGIFKYTSQQLRLWNEVATIFLIAIVMLVVVKQSISLVWGLVGLITLIALLMSAIKIYKSLRSK